MARRPGQHRRGAVDIATEHFNRGLAILRQHPLFTPLLLHAHVLRHAGNVCPEAGWAVVTSNGDIHVHPTRRGDPDVWVHVLAHCLLHLGFGHFQANQRRREWNTACDCVITRFLADLKLGRPPQELLDAPTFSARDEERIYQELCAQGIPAHLQGLGTAGPHHNDMVEDATRWAWRPRTVDWQRYFSQGLTMAVTSAVNVAGGREPLLGADTQHVTPAHKARSWFIRVILCLAPSQRRLRSLKIRASVRVSVLPSLPLMPRARKSSSTLQLGSMSTNAVLSWPTSCCTSACGIRRVVWAVIRICGMWPATMWSMAGWWKWASASYHV